MNAMRNDFLTIPFAPNYEINSQFMVRNKKTGKFLKLRQRTANCRAAKLYISRIGIRDFSVNGLRRKAVEAARDAALVKEDWWVPVPSLNGLYEISPAGVLRNVKTKRRLKKIVNGKYIYYYITINKVKRSFKVADLLWECHGIIPKPLQNIPVTVTRNVCSFDFDSLINAARFLVKHVDFAFETIRGKLSRRVTEIADWKISYFTF